MANINSVYSVGKSIASYLDYVYRQPRVDNEPLSVEYPCAFRVIYSGELDSEPDYHNNLLSVYLYRVIMNEHLRNQASIQNYQNEITPLSLDLHFLMTVWAESSEAEHTICAWVMQQLHSHPIMDKSTLSEGGGWKNGEVIHFIPAELSNEDLMRIWDTFGTNYRLSMSYIARVIRIEPDIQVNGPPVVATRHEYSDKEEAADA